MKKALLLSIAILCISSFAFAQAGNVGVFADPGATNCNLYDAAPGLLTVFIVHVYSPGATAVQFSVQSNHAMVYLSETPFGPYIKIGTCTAGGCSIAFGGCYGTPNVVLEISYFAQALTPPCGWIKVLEDVAGGQTDVMVADCANPPNLLVGTGGIAYVNPDPTCTCDVPVEETSWGQIKSLYK